ASGAGLLQTPLATVLPILAGTPALVWALNAVEAYRFNGREQLAGHLLRASVPFLVLGGLLALWLLVAPVSGDGAGAGAAWLALSFAVIFFAHAGWWAMVARWRRQGRLTPNIVVVGATKHAERLIRGLIATRDANVLGVFDDRLD